MKKQLIGDSVIYLLVTIIQSGAQFLLLPYLTRSLSAEDYANAELFLTAHGLLNLIILFGYNTNIYRDFGKDSSLFHEGKIKKYRRKTYQFLLTNILILFFICIFFRLVGSQKYDYIFYAFFCSSFYVFYIIEVCILQISRLPLKILKLTIFFVLSNVLITVGLIETLNMGFESRVVGYILPSVLIFCYFIFSYKVGKPIVSKASSSYRNNIISLSPFFVSAIFSWIAESSDKLIISELLSLQEVAMYAVGYKFGMIILLCTIAYSKAWLQFVIININENKTILKGIIVSVLLFFLLTFIYFFVISFFYRYLVPSEYHSSITIVYIVGIGYAIDGITKIINSVFIVKGKTSHFVGINIMAGSMNLLLNLCFIPFWGYVGAAYATLTSFVFSATLSSFFYFKIYIRDE